MADSRSWRIGPKCFASDSKFFSIVQAAWHPLSATSSHLLILTSNGILRMFNVSVDVDEPEQWQVTRSDTFGTAEPSRKGFGPNMEEYEAVGFSLGALHDGGGWGCLTVTAVLASGDTVGVCPVLPNEASLSIDWLRGTLEATTTEWKAAETDQTDSRQLGKYYWMKRYLEELMDCHRDASSVYYRPLRHGQSEIQPALSILECLQLLPSDTTSQKASLQRTEFAQDTLFVAFDHTVFQVQLELFQYLDDVSFLPQLDQAGPSLTRQLVDTGDQ
ncbi:hypothetical protein HDU91_005064 [Kappamyces sp. JEL0680]|nr:hypothetical protein HDU91_005064 [Kappamyces sp. JEL0680]